jgi:hypothetical protein
LRVDTSDLDQLAWYERRGFAEPSMRKSNASERARV